MLEIDAIQLRKSLAQDNPWWQDPDWKPLHTKHKRAYFGNFCKMALNLEVQRSVVLMGPRRVGKTVMLMQFIRHVMDQENLFAANRIFFVSVDNPLYSDMPLAELLGLFEAETGCKPEEKRLVIFDEIQYLKDWERHLKVLHDNLPNTKFIVSGSAAAALGRGSKESGAGRFNGFRLPPVTFYEFLQFIGRLDSAADTDKIIALADDIDALNRDFIDYLNYGSYPEAAINPEIRNDPERFIGQDIIERVLLRDLPSLYGIRDPQELNRLFTMLAYNTGNEVNLETLSRSSGGVSKVTILRYIEFLEAAMLIRRVRRIDDTGKTFKRDRTFKVYLTSPAMHAALFGPVDDGSEIMGRLVETAIFAQRVHARQADFLHYARWGKGQKTHEVDMVALSPGNFKPESAWEIKWSDSHTRRQQELEGLAEFRRINPQIVDSCYATTKTAGGKLEIRGVKIICAPTALFCCMAGSIAVSNLDSNINAPALRHALSAKSP